MSEANVLLTEIMADHLSAMPGIQGGYWWHTHRFSLLKMFFKGTKVDSLLDFGCGNGDFLAAVARDGLATTLAAYDPNPAAQVLLAKRGALRNQVKFLDEDFGQQHFAVITLLDVLEHVDDDRATLRKLVPHLAPGGRIMITVPASMIFWSRWDVLLGHRRRYTKAALTHSLADAGLVVEKMSHYFSFLCLPAFLRRFARPAANHADDDVEFPRISSLVNRVLLLVGSVESFWLRYLPVPFGTSIIAVAKVPE